MILEVSNKTGLLFRGSSFFLTSAMFHVKHCSSYRFEMITRTTNGLDFTQQRGFTSAGITCKANNILILGWENE